jgi:dTDP-4-amino-4,6-dideoxygalactose transaminase
MTTAPNSRIHLSTPHLGAEERRFVEYAFETNWIAPMGPNLNGFEQDLMGILNVKHAVGLSSGTAAIHLALILLGVGPGDEVICQSMTFAASANPIVYLGATPIFIDSERSTWNMDPEVLRDALKSRLAMGKRIKAVIPVHLYGMPADMASINAICEEYGVPVIEDAAEALGSKLHGRHCGSLADVGILSFNGNKIITTSGGGALLTHDDTLANRARYLATQAREAAVHYEHSEIGYNYRLSNVLAGIGRGQMLVLNERVVSRRHNYERYMAGLDDLKGIHFLVEPEGYYSNRWLTTFLIDHKESGGVTSESLRLSLERSNIESRPLWKPMHLQPVYREAPYYGSDVAESLYTSGLCVPSGSNLASEQLAYVIDSIRSVWD